MPLPRNSIFPSEAAPPRGTVCREFQLGKNGAGPIENPEGRSRHPRERRGRDALERPPAAHGRRGDGRGDGFGKKAEVELFNRGTRLEFSTVGAASL